jgi:hypothetical protein
MSSVLDGWQVRFPNGDLRWLAYMFATTYHETARQMIPVREAYWLSEEWRKNNLPYYPYYGRGFVQLTHKSNYEHAGDVLGVDMVSNPDLALVFEYAAVVMFTGMTEGWFRKDSAGVPHSLPRYFSDSIDDPIRARRIINGYEPGVAEAIEGYHQKFLAALQSVNQRLLMATAGAMASGHPVGAVSAASTELFRLSADREWAVGQSGATPIQKLAGDIVLAYLAKNPVSRAELPDLIADVFVAISNADVVVARTRQIEDRQASPNAGPKRARRSERES